MQFIRWAVVFGLSGSNEFDSRNPAGGEDNFDAQPGYPLRQVLERALARAVSQRDPCPPEQFERCSSVWIEHCPVRSLPDVGPQEQGYRLLIERPRVRIPPPFPRAKPATAVLLVTTRLETGRRWRIIEGVRSPTTTRRAVVLGYRAA